MCGVRALLFAGAAVAGMLCGTTARAASLTWPFPGAAPQDYHQRVQAVTGSAVLQGSGPQAQAVTGSAVLQGSGPQVQAITASVVLLPMTASTGAIPFSPFP